ncbi:transcription activator GutR [Podospora conica]|nr:transcription activator GutR [Schizothecium conicum]
MAPATGSRPKDQKLLEKHVWRAKAPLAAEFEDCTQSSIRLTDALQANRPHLNKLRDLGQECKDRLAFWGENSGATTRTLDYNLKCSPMLVQQTLTLLDDLNKALAEAARSIRPLVFEAEPHELNNEKAAVAAILEDYDLDLNPELWLTEAVDVVDYLVKLLPAYHNPLSEQTHSPPSRDSEDDSGEFSAEWYTKEAAALFPAASRILLKRLGKVNWRRRQYLHQIRERPRTTTSTGTATVTVRASPHSEVGHPASTAPAPRSAGRVGRPSTVVHFKPSSSRHTTRTWTEFSDTATTTESQITSIVSRTLDTDQASAYSTTESLLSTSLQALTLPAPPVDLDNVPGGVFNCSICHFELPLTVSAPKVTPQDWVDHVYLDLKPYMCTFDGCNWGNAMYGVKRDWFQHELDCHRTSTVWSCGICRSDFGSEPEFLGHLDHHNIGSNKPALVVDSCKRFSQDHPSLQCQLCHESCPDLTELEDHVANHLEYFALAALLEDSPVTLPEAASAEEYPNIQDYLADLSDDEGPRVHETKTIRASSPPAPATSSAPGPPPTEGSRNAAPSDVSIPDDPEKEFPHQRDQNWNASVKKAVEDKVNKFLRHARQAVPAHQEPRMSNVPPRDEKFFGRDADLDRMHASLSQMGRICTVTGRGGIGKTATAKEYLHLYREEYGFIFWVDAENPGVLQQKYLMIANVMDTGGASFHDESNRIIFVRECLSRSEQRWLLVLDNVGTFGEITRYIPRNLSRTRGSILVTRRGTNPITVPAMYIQDHIHLEPWSVAHSRQFLLTSISKNIAADNLRAHDEYDLAEEVVEKVDRLPLAVNMVVGYIKVSRTTLAEFLEMWAEKALTNRRRPKSVRKTGEGIDPTIDSLWEIGIAEVRANCRKLLDVLSFFGYETIPRSLLVANHEEDYLEFLHEESMLRYNRMISQLDRQKLIEIKEENGEPAYSIHRVLQEKIQRDLDVYSFADAFRKAFRLIRKRFPAADPQQVPIQANMAVCEKYMPHVAGFFAAYTRHNEEQASISIGDVDPVEVAGLFYDAAFFVWGGQSTAYQGPPYLEAADKILDDKKVQGNKKMRADINCIYGLLFLNMGYKERRIAAERLEQAWVIRRELYEQRPVVGGDEDVLSQNAANDFSICLMNHYKFKRAKRLMQGCRDRYELWGTAEKHPFEYSKFYGNYAVVLLAEARFEEAIEYCKQCLELTERFAGRNSQYYRRLFFLGCIYLQAGDLQKALDTHLDALKQRITLQGLYHENTIMSMYAVGAMFHYLGDLANAIDYMKQCIRRAQTVRWPQEAYGRVEHHLALIYDERGADGDREEAERLRVDSKMVLEKYRLFTPQHIQDTGDEMMIFDDMQGTFTGRYTGTSLLKHIRSQPDPDDVER